MAHEHFGRRIADPEVKLKSRARCRATHDSAADAPARVATDGEEPVSVLFLKAVATFPHLRPDVPSSEPEHLDELFRLSDLVTKSASTSQQDAAAGAAEKTPNFRNWLCPYTFAICGGISVLVDRQDDGVERR
jgi:hypothetical protein